MTFTFGKCILLPQEDGSSLLLFLERKSDGSEVGFFEAYNESDVHQCGAVYRQVLLGNIVKLVFIKPLHDDAIVMRVAMVEASVACEMCLRLILRNDGKREIIALKGILKSVKIAFKHKVLHLLILHHAGVLEKTFFRQPFY